MRIMTYNIRLGIQKGLEPLAEIIRASGADIVALQEVGQNWSHGPAGDTTAKLSELTGLPHAIYAPAIEEERDSKPSCYGHALLSRWPVIDYTVVALPQIEDEQRLAISSIVDCPFGLLKIISTHLSHRETDRPSQVVDLLDRVHGWLEEDGPHLLLGDLNADPSEAWIAELKTLMKDADPGPEAFTYPASNPRVRIDYLFARGGAWQDVEVIEESEASDHRPVVATWTPDKG